MAGRGRCRLHGGKSTGARTAEGLARCRTATLVHGHRTAEIIDLKSAAARHGRRLRTLTQAARRLATSGPQSERPTPCPATSRLALERKSADERGSAQVNADGLSTARSHVLAKSAFIPSLSAFICGQTFVRGRAEPTVRATHPMPGDSGQSHDPPLALSHGHGMSALPFILRSCYSMAGSQAMGTPDRDDRGRHRIAAAA